MMKTTSLIFTLLLSLSCFAKEAPSHQIWDDLLQKHVSEKGVVDYKGFIKDSVKLNEYLTLLSSNAPSNSWSKNEKMAFWINAYNAFTVQLICRNYPVKSIKDIGGSVYKVNTTWDIKFIKIGDETLDLNNIEHQKLRKKFKDARIHFALVCASKSCPILLNQAYTAEKLEEQFTSQAKLFLGDTFRNDLSDVNNPKLSKLFDWYGMDFKTKKMTKIQFINQFLTVKIPENAKLEYLDYDWNLNE